MFLRAAPVLAALLVAGMLTACSSTTTSTPVPTPTPTPTPTRAALGVYAVAMNGTGNTASPGPVGSLSFTLYSQSTIADNVNHVLHVTATYTVTNKGAALVRPVYLPLVTAGTFGTQDGTPFRSVLTRKGVAVSAAGMSVEVSQQLSGSTIQTDPQASPLVAVNTAGLTVTPPDGTSVSSLGAQGWQGAAIPAGGTALVNFAARIPLKGADVGDSDPFSFDLVFAVADSQ